MSEKILFKLPIEKTDHTVDEALVLNQNILQNIYRAFDYTKEEDIYDKLAVSIEGDLLPDIYIQVKKSMALENQRGLEVKVNEVEVKSINEIDTEKYYVYS